MWQHPPRRRTLVKADTLQREHNGSAIQQLLQHRSEHFHAFYSLNYPPSPNNPPKRQLKSSRLHGRTQHPTHGWSWKCLQNSVRTIREHPDQLLAKWWNPDSFRRKLKDILQAASPPFQDRNALEVGANAVFAYPPRGILQKRIPRQHVLPEPKMLQIQATAKSPWILQETEALQPDCSDRRINVAFAGYLECPIEGSTVEPLQEISLQNTG